MKSLKFIGVGLIVLMCFATCRKIEEPSYQIAADSQIFKNVAYGTDPKQVMDVYLPPNRTSNTNVIIFVHGGSFIGGDKNEFETQVRYLMSKGYAVLNVNYRLVTSTGVFDVPPKHLESPIKVKDQIDDMSTIVDFAISHAKTWVMSGTRIGMAGHSAGGTLALLYGYDVRNTNKIQVISNIAGAVDMIFTDVPGWQLYPAFALEGAYRLTGAVVDPVNEPQYKAISPLYIANANKLIPTLNILPENNDVMGLPKLDLATYNRFTAKLNELKVKNEFVFMSGSDHYFSRTGDWQIVLLKTISYFNTNIK